MRGSRPYVDVKTRISLYAAVFYPHSISDIEFYGHAANCYLDQIYLLQKSTLRIILKIPPGGHVTSYFKEFHIMPIKMLFKYKFLIHFHKLHLDGDLDLQKQVLAPQDQRPFFNPREPTTAEGIDHC